MILFYLVVDVQVLCELKDK
uniref:Uncharacterized protein n=1 Tax=Arundo donax TaxID=35708 RepID=A0A0A9HWQ3_ARUDO